MPHFRDGPLAPGVAFITGGARGLGNAIAVSFAKEGARGIVIVDINDEKTMAEGKAAIEKYGTKVLAIRADVTKEDQVESAVAQAVAEFGRIDYAANFAGILGRPVACTEMTFDDWRQVMDINSSGVWLCTKYELQQMMKQDPLVEPEEGRISQRGSIVNCASVNSRQAGAGTTGYTASKHAVAGITKAAALEARGHNIRVNAVSPGFLLTQLLAPALSKKELPREAWDACVARQGREAEFSEVGDVVVLLSTPRMSLVNGVNLPIDNGFTINEMPA